MYTKDLCEHTRKFPELNNYDFIRGQSFVFSQELMLGNPDEPLIVDEDNVVSLLDVEIVAPLNDDEILASPFPTFSIEYDSGMNKSTPLAYYGDPSESIERFGYSIPIYWVGCRELSPNEYSFTLFVSKGVGRNGVGGKAEILTVTQVQVNAYATIMAVVKNFLKFMRGASIGYIRTPRTINSYDLRLGKQKQKLQKPIYIYSRRKFGKDTCTELSGKKVITIHSWSVMGHWRRKKPEFIGKDRLGNRTVKGYTWITNYIKGDKDLSGRIAIRKVT